MLSNMTRSQCRPLLQGRAPTARPFHSSTRHELYKGPSRSPVVLCCASSATPEVKINIEGMMCDGCSSRIEKVLKGMDTVKSVTVSLEGKVAVVQLVRGDAASAEAKADAAAFVDTINGMGFEAKLSP